MTDYFKTFLKELFHAYWVLLKLMVPALLIVKVLQELGATEWLAKLLSPLMGLVGLPSELGLVWAASILTNVYTAMVVFYELGQGQGYTVAQVSTLGVMVLLAHALPVEGAVAKVMGVQWRLTLVLRIVGGFVLALMSFLFYELVDVGSEPAELVWRPEASPPGLLYWLWDQVVLLGSIFMILAALMLFLRALRAIGFERILNILLSPLMKGLSVGKQASDVTIIGLMLGLSFGAGLLITESRSGRIPIRDMKIVVCFLGLCHSIIEDTLLILLLGADIYMILVGRLVFSLVVMMLVVRLIYTPGSPRIEA